MKLLNFLGFLVVLAVVLILASPLALVIKFPASAKHISTVASIMIPWLCIVLLVFVFNNGIKNLFTSIAGAIDRIKRVSGSGAEFEDRQQDEAPPLTQEQVDELSQYVQSLESEKTTQTNWAWHFFLRFVRATVYGTQVKLLQDLELSGAMPPDELVQYYNMFLSRQPTSTGYKFKQYLEYLTSNLLVAYDAAQAAYHITDEGKHFLNAMKEGGLSWEDIPG